MHTIFKMKKTIVLGVLLWVAGMLSAQVTVTVVTTAGTSQELTLDATGEIYLNSDHMIVMCNAADGNTVSFAMDEIRKVLFSGPVSLHDVSSAAPLTLYPNPAGDRIAIGGVGNEPQQISIYNASGVKVQDGIYREGDVLDISSLPQGAYLVRVGESFVKLIKR